MTRMRFRTDASHWADLRGQGFWWHPWYGDREEFFKTPRAEPGDTWRLTWHGTQNCAGYAICCPLCKKVHFWSTARNCHGNPCPHHGVSSCWTWFGSAEQNTLSAAPSLYSVAEYGGCGWHGFLSNGVLSG